ncbi:hypothetical protein U9R90_12690 [Streptomyces sp. E11-3]|uniref:hypothetical protein n=1 Tax=Streptomyces sp. E11-3 TaxID=3110112 RepID=UPI003980F503
MAGQAAGRTARHAAPGRQARALLRTGLTLAVAGAALGAGGAAGAEPLDGIVSTSPDQPLTKTVTDTAASALAPAKSLQLDPLAGTGVDPLDNAAGTQVADFQPVSTADATYPLTSGGALEDLPVAGDALGLLPG